MSKPTEEQKDVAKVISEIAKSWSETNDIDSPTHYSDAKELLQTLDLEDDLTQLLTNKANDIFQIIRQLTK